MKRNFTYLFSTLLFLFFCGQVSANHLLGGEINYRFVSANGNMQTYRVKLSLFADCSSNFEGGAYQALINANPEVRLYIADIGISSLRLTYNAAESDIEITPVCPDEAGNTTCSNINNPLPGIKKFVYEGNFTLNGTSPFWRFAFEGSITGGSFITSAGRSFIIQNAVLTDPNTGGATIMYLEATLNNTNGPNSSTTFTSPPTPFFCLNKAATYSLGAADQENDQLSFSMIPGKTFSGGAVTDVVYIPPFTAQNPLPVVPGSFNFNTTNGQMNFTPNQVMNCLVTNLVEEFRNGVKVGSSMREMTFVILNNCNNDAPLDTVSNVTNATITSNPNGDLTLSVCEGQTDDISFDIAAGDPNGDNTNISYSNLPQGATLTINNNGSGNPKLHFTWNATDAAPGSYIFYITYTDDGCPLVSTKTIAYTIIIVPHPVPFEVGSIPTCINMSNGKAWVVPESGTTTNYTYKWTDAEGNTLAEHNSANGDTLTNLAKGTYKVHLRDPDGCGKTVEIIVSEIPLPELQLPADTVLCIGMPLDVAAVTEAGVNYSWNTGVAGCCITVTAPGIYTITATNSCGNVTEDIKIDYVKCNFCLFVPNAFSPNGDGKNDKFNILETCLVEKYKLQIFNRWGELVFTTLTTTKSWDGTYNGKDAEAGVYFYVIDATPEDKSKGTIQLKGDLTLIR